MTLFGKDIFLIDGVGALLSFFSLGVLLPLFQKFIGMPLNILYLLASIALIFAGYSLFCFWKLKENRKKFLRVIAVANLSYCVLTAVLVVTNFETITPLGVAYFLGEIAIILGLVVMEWKISSEFLAKV